MNNAIDLTRLSAPEVLETVSYEAVYQQLEAQLQQHFPDYPWLPSDPAIKLMELFAYREVLLRQRVNDAAQSVMVAYAKGSDLDHLGVLFGVPREENEPDERYRLRIPLSLESHSMAGTNGAYQYHAFTASAKVKDVYVESSLPGIVEVYILPVASVETLHEKEALRTEVLRYLNNEDVRPLTDLVRVHLVEPTQYTIEADIYFNAGINTEQVKVAINQAVNAFIQSHYLLGKEVPSSGLIDALHQGGVRKVKLHTMNDDIVSTVKEAAFCRTIQLHFPTE
ncbi:baseplate J/gp47 family protein [Pseudoalteromonas sp. SCSIO 43201]|uniref:baseplate assembly protein n=1 Tax=Pseudoalteromonas sp. SCSIO 43201 TaxID=2822842 RepID=UPI0020760080|nr:baseplate J/gp47 family protein [Pseudoalteromonas sp. SCSIO 43201]USD29452.1 baseplate J/gp47 family protein [Pseudoalteromonas sp. SCSIO 43201]